MSLDDVREYEAKLQSQTNSLLADKVGGGDSNTQETPDTPKTPKSPKKGYFSWF